MLQELVSYTHLDIYSEDLKTTLHKVSFSAQASMCEISWMDQTVSKTTLLAMDLMQLIYEEKLSYHQWPCSWEQFVLHQ